MRQLIRSGERWATTPRFLTTDKMSRRTKQHYDYGQKNLCVLLDLDQVLADFEGHFITKFREKFPDDPFVQLDERKGFYIKDQYEKLDGNLGDKVRAVYIEKGFFLDLPEIKGAISAAREMAATDGVDVFICSSPLTEYQFCLPEKFEWVEKHLGPEWLDRIIIAKDKTVINGHILIDDRPRINGSCKSPTWKHIIFTAHHNRHIEGRQRLDNWTDGTWRDILEDFKKRI
ncbi:5'(3')-deoxyribonucleotidase, cytosolic type isoform X2 [Patella vulgata]|nr:5'(3')-deoxyribonucleotidase, cytosolic type isoform X2 [Patella vulgata]